MIIFDKRFNFYDCRFINNLLIVIFGRRTEKSAAAKRSEFADSAADIHIEKWTSIGDNFRNNFDVFNKPGEFQIGCEEVKTAGIEIAAVFTVFTRELYPTDDAVHLAIQIMKELIDFFTDRRILKDGLDGGFDQHGDFFNVPSISSSVKSRPRLMPGQRRVFSRKSSPLSRL